MEAPWREAKTEESSPQAAILQVCEKYPSYMAVRSAVTTGMLGAHTAAVMHTRDEKGTKARGLEGRHPET